MSYRSLKDTPTREACHAHSEEYGHESGNRVRWNALAAVIPARRISLVRRTDAFSGITITGLGKPEGESQRVMLGF